MASTIYSIITLDKIRFIDYCPGMKNREVAFMGALALGTLGCGDGPEVERVKGKLQWIERSIYSEIGAIWDLKNAGKCRRIDPYKIGDFRCPEDIKDLNAYTKDHSDATDCMGQAISSAHGKALEESGSGEHVLKIRCDIGKGMQEEVYQNWIDPDPDSEHKHTKEVFSITTTQTVDGHQEIVDDIRLEVEVMMVGEPGERDRFTFHRYPPNSRQDIDCTFIPEQGDLHGYIPSLSMYCSGEDPEKFTYIVPTDVVRKIRKNFKSHLDGLKELEKMKIQ